MPWILQFIGLAIFLIGMAVALWAALWILVALFALGVVLVGWAHIKNYLLRKGILNPTPGIPPQAETVSEITVIEGDYKRVESE